MKNHPFRLAGKKVTPASKIMVLYSYFYTMSLYIASLNSGSNANCYYIGNKTEAVLIDAGLSCRETEKRMHRLGLSFSAVKALFVSHEHIDHIAGLPVISRKYRIPVFITAPTLAFCTFKLEKELIQSFTHKVAVKVGNMSVLPFKKSHDARDPHSFLVSGNGINIGVITDIGYACSRVTRHFKLCDAVFLESNYCEHMLTNGSYPEHLKKRIKSKKGHLSNEQAFELFMKHRPPNLRLLILSHLSQNNNHPAILQKMFSGFEKTLKIVIASRHKESELYRVEKSELTIPGKKKNIRQTGLKRNQLSLFD